jgi:hypothetical protein
MRGNALLVLLGLTFGCTKAGTPTDGHMSRGDQARMAESEALHKRGEAEYHRLSDELQVFASKNAWTAVERVFRKINKTGHPLGQEEWLAGARSAQFLGNVKALHHRLSKALLLKEEQVVLDWLWAIDREYGKIFVAADIGTAALGVEKMPFDPTHKKAILFAQSRVEETGVFDGHLPEGVYRFGEHTVVVNPHASAPRIDLRRK